MPRYYTTDPLADADRKDRDDLSVMGLPVPRDQLRPCYTGDGRRALFHRWADIAEPLEASPFVGGPTAGQFWRVYGVVEFEDGTVCCLPLEQIKFFDSAEKMRCYAWNSAAQTHSGDSKQ